MLSLLLIIPIIGSIALLLVTDDPSGVRSKKIAIATSLLNLIISIYLWVQFDSSTSQYQFVYSFKELSYCHLNIGVDGLSIYFLLLTTFLTPVALLSNYNTINNNLKYFLISFLVLETLQIALFVVLDLLLFYVFFESILPILFIVIILYGSGANKERSAFLFFLYTLAGSLFMLLAILEISNYVGSTDFQLISLSEINLDSQKFLWLAFFLAFAIKTPLWPMTGWLYRAHADSPLAGSILLAGTILKMATYGYLRVLINFLPDATHYFSPLVQTIALITIVYASLATIVQQDTKQLIAYSSICHMGVVVLGLFSNTIQGIEGAIIFSIAHGFVSPALFICVGGVIYDRTGVRLIPYIRGLVLYMPLFTILFFIFTLCNTGIPLSLNFIGEQLSLIGIWERNPLAAILGATGIVFSAIYSIWLYNRVSYGSYSPYLKPLRDITRREFILLISLLIPTIVLGVYPNVILDTLHVATTTLLYNIPLTPLSKILNLSVFLINSKTNIYNFDFLVLNIKSIYLTNRLANKTKIKAKNIIKRLYSHLPKTSDPISLQIINKNTNKLNESNSNLTKKELSVALVSYLDKDFLMPILNIQNKSKLLAPIVFSVKVLNQIEQIQFILSRVPDYNLVRIWLKIEFENNILINGKLSKIANNLFKEIVQIKTITKETIYNKNIKFNSGTDIKNSLYTNTNTIIHPIKQYKLPKLGLNKDESVFNELQKDFTNKILKNKKYQNFACCYIISFENKYYYYIGSTTNIKNRFQTHKLNIKNYNVNSSQNGLSLFFKHFLNSEFKGKTPKNLDITILYLTTNYLHKFKDSFPNYVLSKGEWLLLSKITDFTIKLLEESLIFQFKPKLNSAKKVVFKHFDWDETLLQYYSVDGKVKDYIKARKYAVYVRRSEKNIINKLPIFINTLSNLDPALNMYTKLDIINSDNIGIFLGIKTLQGLCSKYNLNKNDILKYLGYYHHYQGSLFKNPLKIVEIK